MLSGLELFNINFLFLSHSHFWILDLLIAVCLLTTELFILFRIDSPFSVMLSFTFSVFLHYVLPLFCVLLLYLIFPLPLSHSFPFVCFYGRSSFSLSPFQFWRVVSSDLLCVTVPEEILTPTVASLSLSLSLPPAHILLTN